jgi:hypothetical protein
VILIISYNKVLVAFGQKLLLCLAISFYLPEHSAVVTLSPSQSLLQLLVAREVLQRFWEKINSPTKRKHSSASLFLPKCGCSFDCFISWLLHPFPCLVHLVILVLFQKSLNDALLKHPLKFKLCKSSQFC